MIYSNIVLAFTSTYITITLSYDNKTIFISPGLRYLGRIKLTP